MNVYLLVMKICGIITEAKAFTDYKVAVQTLKVWKEFCYEANLYTINTEALDDEIKELRVGI